ncbi:MAG TPA: TrkA C-terminal domain-containing protein [Syntrophales bacterium]|nr:TrkA C-terminal domain-containing protein [Syntrophales bacterium]
MDLLKTLLEQSPIMALFLAIAVGYAVGEINLKGFSLGVGAVLFVGLAIGAFAPKSVPPALLGSLGLVMFLYGIGIQYGKQFFAGMAGPAGRRYNLLAVIGILAALGVAWAAMKFLNLKPAYVAGLYSGALTNTPALQAALEIAGNNDPAVGYSVAYPFGIIVSILGIYIAAIFLKPKVEAPLKKGLELVELVIRNAAVIGKRLEEVETLLPSEIEVAAVRRNHVTRIASLDIILEAGDSVLVVGANPEAVETAKKLLGEMGLQSILHDRENFEYIRVYASKRTVVGSRLSDLVIPAEAPFRIVNIRRGDAHIVPDPDLILEFGDQLGIFAELKHAPVLRAHFGDSIKGTTEFSYISIGIGMVLGVILGLIPIPIPGLGTTTLGIASGPLIVSLILGKLGRTGGLVWTMPVTANLTLRNFGLTIFLAQVGISSGNSLMASIGDVGILFLCTAALIIGVTVLTILVIGHVVMKVPFDDLVGIISGAVGNPAILAYGVKTVPTDRPDIDYAMIFPGGMILKVILVQLMMKL